jgi:hypothetical protein
MQGDNQKLKKEIKAKLEKMSMMEDKLDEFSRKNKEASDVISIYSALLGVNIEKLYGKERSFKIYICDKPGSDKRVFEATMEQRKSSIGQDEWHVHLERLPMPSIGGNAVGDKLVYSESQLSNFYEMVKDAAQLT